MTARHRAECEILPVAALFDEVRREWIRLYAAACAMPASEARRERLACLREARSQIHEASQELATDDAELSLDGVIPLNVAVGACKRD